MRAAIYARFSSDLQSDRSIDDQVRLCRDHGAKLGAEIVTVYADYAISGGHLKSRPQAIQLLADARSGHFDILICEALDRLSRDQEDVAGLFKRLRFAGVQIMTVAEGEVSELHVGLKGTMNALFLKDLAQKVRRGQEGRARQGFVAGGRAYGYTVVRELDGRGDPVRGKRIINEAEAEIVRRIFRDYAAGLAPRSIAQALNRERVPAPTGGLWRASTINGSTGRRRGILSNDVYIGKLIWNRSSITRDPETGRRLARDNPPEKWIIIDAQHLRLVSDEMWNAAQSTRRHYAARAKSDRRRPKHLFSGLTICACCGSRYTVSHDDRISCALRREARSCENDRTVRVGDLERRVLTGITDQLLNAEAVSIFMRAYRDERLKLAGARRQELGEISRRIATMGRQITNIVDAIAEGIATPEMRARLAALESDRDRHKAELVNLEADDRMVIDLYPEAAEEWRRFVIDVREGIGREDEDARTLAAAKLRKLVDRIEISPGTMRGEYGLAFYGNLGALAGLSGPVGMAEGKGFGRNRANTVAMAEGAPLSLGLVKIAC